MIKKADNQQHNAKMLESDFLILMLKWSGWRISGSGRKEKGRNVSFTEEFTLSPVNRLRKDMKKVIRENWIATPILAPNGWNRTRNHIDWISPWQLESAHVNLITIDRKKLVKPNQIASQLLIQVWVIQPTYTRICMSCLSTQTHAKEEKVLKRNVNKLNRGCKLTKWGAYQ